MYGVRPFPYMYSKIANDKYYYTILEDESEQNPVENEITEDTKIKIGKYTFNLFTGGIGGENTSEFENIDDVLNVFNCAIKKVMVECDKLDALSNILDLREKLQKNTTKIQQKYNKK